MHRYSKSSIQRTRERCRVRENVTRKRARPRKWAWDQIGENVISEKWIWDETVRQIVRPSLPSPHSPTWGASMLIRGSRAGDTSLLFVPVFASTSKCNCMQTNWSICTPLVDRFTTISIFGVVQVMTTWWKECRELIGLCRSLKRRHRPIGSALIGLPRRSDQRWSADYRRNIGRWSISKESCNISQGWMGSPS